MGYPQHPTRRRVSPYQLNPLPPQTLAHCPLLLHMLCSPIINLRVVLPSIPMDALAIMTLMAVKSCVKQCSLLTIPHILALLSTHMPVNMIPIKKILQKRNRGFRLPQARGDVLGLSFPHQLPRLLNHCLQHLFLVSLTRRPLRPNIWDTGEMALGGSQGLMKRMRVQ